MENKENRFNIDFFEFSVLVEACIPPKPIGRTMFFHKVIDHYYHILDQEERNRLYEWLLRDHRFREKLEEGEEDCVWFERRYNPDNQYRVTTDFHGEIKEEEVFKVDDRYYKTRITWIREECITNIEKL